MARGAGWRGTFAGKCATGAPRRLELELTIFDLGRGGAGLARLPDGRLAVVPRTLPGERVRVRLHAEHGRRVDAEVVEILSAHPQRVIAPCVSYARCGGCQLQHLSYAGQLELKHARLVRQLARALGDAVAARVEPVVAAPAPLGYRNKNLLQRGGGGYGFLDLFGEQPVPVLACPLAAPGADLAFATVRDWLAAAGAELEPAVLAILIRCGEGMRQVILVLDEAMVTDPRLETARTLAAALPDASLWASRKRRGARQALGRDLVHLGGPELVLQRTGPFVLALSPGSFAQVNADVAAQLYAHAVTELALVPGEDVLDLYCGSGALALHLAGHARSVLGVELDHATLLDAQRSAARNGVSHVAFRAGRAETICERLWKKGQRFPKATLNPPRLGLHPELPRWLGQLGITRIVYVSCSPPTLVRDLVRLAAHGFTVERVVPFDQFAQTYHLEVAVTLGRTDPAAPRELRPGA